MKRILDIKVGDEFGDLIYIAINPPSKSTNNTTTFYRSYRISKL